MASLSGNTGITGGISGIHNRVPPFRIRGNTGITGGLNVPNNRVPDTFEQPRAGRPLTAAQFLSRGDSATNVNGQALTYPSESDFPVLVNDLGRAPRSNTGETPFKALESILTDGVFADIAKYTKELTFEASKGSKALADFASRGKNAEGAEKTAWKKLNDLTKQLSDVTFIKIGPKDANGKLAQDSGLYAYALTGKTSDGKLVAVHFGSVET